MFISGKDIFPPRSLFFDKMGLEVDFYLFSVLTICKQWWLTFLFMVRPRGNGTNHQLSARTLMNLL